VTVNQEPPASVTNKDIRGFDQGGGDAVLLRGGDVFETGHPSRLAYDLNYGAAD
jgi:hypothetical protein